MSSPYCHFPPSKGEIILQLLEISDQFPLGPRLFPIGSVAILLISIGPFSIISPPICHTSCKSLCESGKF
jgi:hypothetical protein